MANLSAIKLPNGTTYNLKDNGALQLTGGQVTGPVTFGDSVSIDDLTAGQLVVEGSASVANNLQVNTINGVTVGSSPKFTDTNTEVSTLTLAAGTTAGTSLAYGGKYTLTAGSKTVSFTMPSADDTNTWRTIQVNGTDILGSGTGTGKLNLKAGTGISISNSSGTVTITNSSTNTDTKLQVAEVTSATQYYPIVGTGTTAATRQYDTTGFTYKGTNGTTSAVGSSILVLGNATGSGTANNKQAQLIMYGSNTKKATITLAAPSADIALALPTSGGTFALTSQIPSVPTSAASKVTGISIADHGTTSIGSASNWSAGTASSWVFEEISIPNVTAAGSGSYSHSGFSGGSGSFGATVTNHVLSFSHTHTAAVYGTDSHTHTAPTIGTAIKVQSKKSGSNSTVPSLTITSTTVVNGKSHSITDPGHTHTLS